LELVISFLAAEVGWASALPTPQRGCRPLGGLAAAAKEEQRKEAQDSGLDHVVTVAQPAGRRQAHRDHRKPLA
jgi:hypothetical protein